MVGPRRARLGGRVLVGAGRQQRRGVRAVRVRSRARRLARSLAHHPSLVPHTRLRRLDRRRLRGVAGRRGRRRGTAHHSHRRDRHLPAGGGDRPRAVPRQPRRDRRSVRGARRRPRSGGGGRRSGAAPRSTATSSAIYSADTGIVPPAARDRRPAAVGGIPRRRPAPMTPVQSVSPSVGGEVDVVTAAGTVPRRPRRHLRRCVGQPFAGAARPCDPAHRDPRTGLVLPVRRQRPAAGRFPVWIWMDDPSFYGFPVYGHLDSIKASEDCGGPEVDPDTRSFEPDAGHGAPVVDVHDRAAGRPVRRTADDDVPLHAHRGSRLRRRSCARLRTDLRRARRRPWLQVRGVVRAHAGRPRARTARSRPSWRRSHSTARRCSGRSTAPAGSCSATGRTASVAARRWTNPTICTSWSGRCSTASVRRRPPPTRWRRHPTWLAPLYTAQVQSRVLDHTARWLRGSGKGYYTIGSAGHESNGAVAAALRPTDPALLHYRSGAFYCARAQQRPGHDPVRDVLAGMLALASEPIAGGRHKVFGHHDLAVIPQTSTIASHLPRALGVAFAIGRARRLGVATAWPAGRDRGVLVRRRQRQPQHRPGRDQRRLLHRPQRTAGAAAVRVRGQRSRHQRPDAVRVDRGDIRRPPVAASTRRSTAPIRSAFTPSRPTLADHVRASGRPALLHLRTVRYMGHAGTDVESGYRSISEHPRRLSARPDPGDGAGARRVRGADTGRARRRVPDDS